MRAKMGERIRYYNEVIMTYEGEACLDWPFGVNDHGCPLYKRRGQTKKAARYICEDVRGPPMLPGLEAEHLCGNRMCVNPAHIDWNTRRGNNLRKKEHGTMPKKEDMRRKLTEAKVLALRADRENLGLTYKVLAAKYGISITHVTAIIARHTWKTI